MKPQTAHTIGVDSTEVSLAGQSVPAGIYRNVETGREVVMENDGILPGACDGRVAVYTRRPATWGELASVRREFAA